MGSVYENENKALSMFFHAGPALLPLGFLDTFPKKRGQFFEYIDVKISHFKILNFKIKSR